MVDLPWNRRARLGFWLRVVDLTYRFRLGTLGHWVYLWALDNASGCIDWGEPSVSGQESPW